MSDNKKEIKRLIKIFEGPMDNIEYQLGQDRPDFYKKHPDDLYDNQIHALKFSIRLVSLIKEISAKTGLAENRFSFKLSSTPLWGFAWSLSVALSEEDDEVCINDLKEDYLDGWLGINGPVCDGYKLILDTLDSEVFSTGNSGPEDAFSYINVVTI